MTITIQNLVVCETTAAISYHLRVIKDETEIKLGGHRFPRPKTLCDTPAAWDTRIPVADRHGALIMKSGQTVRRCQRCIDAAKKALGL